MSFPDQLFEGQTALNPRPLFFEHLLQVPALDSAHCAAPSQAYNEEGSWPTTPPVDNTAPPGQPEAGPGRPWPLERMLQGRLGAPGTTGGISL